MQRRPVFFQATIAGFLAAVLLTAVLLTASLLALPAGAATSEAEDETGLYARPEVWEYADWVEDSGLPSARREGAWLEDGRVLFPMIRLIDPTNRRAIGNAETVLTIWTPGTPGEAAEIHTEDYSGRLCYANGQVSYEQREQTTGRRFWVTGRLGEERRVTPADREPGTRYNRMACRRESWPERWAGQNWIDPLRPGHGWIRQRPAPVREPGEVFLYPTADHPGIELGLNDEDVNPACFRWIVWRQAYFTDYCGGRMLLDYDRLRGVWLWPDGRVEVPDLPPAGNVSWIWPVPAGWLVSINQIGLTDDLNDSGIYLWRDGEFRLLIPGLSHDVAVTGDGCRIAFDHAPSYGALSLEQDWRLKTLKVIDLCGYLDRILEEAPVFDPLARYH